MTGEEEKPRCPYLQLAKSTKPANLKRVQDEATHRASSLPSVCWVY